MITTNLLKKLKNLPSFPGVYRFLDKSGSVLYIGKAKNLRARVRQYFSGDDGRPQIPFLMKEVADLDYTVVNTELESLYLERTLIQQHRPKYNIELKDDKSYAFIVVDYSTQIPRIVIKRRFPDDNSKFLMPNSKSNHKSKILNHKSDFFGPYTSSAKIKEILRTARKIFSFCANEKITGKPCFYFHLHRCPGVCVGAMSLDNYRRHLDKIKLFLSGKIAPVIKNIKMNMLAAAKQKNFEAAARLRDQLKALEILGNRQNVIIAKPVNWDVIGLANDEGMWGVNLFKIRSGRMLDKENFIYDINTDIRIGRGSTDVYGLEVLQKFLEEYYAETSDAPREILLAPTVASGLPTNVENADLIKNLIKDRFKKSVRIIAPKKGKAKQLVLLSQTNAQEYLKNYLNAKAGHLDKVQRGLAQLKEIFKLPAIPKRIEGFDISNIQGTNPVGSMVVFVDGLPAKSQYRKFKITTKDTPDDFAMMREMISRRLSKTLSPSPSPNGRGQGEGWPMPDLMVIDGGRGQLNVALEVVRSIRFSDSSDFPVIGLAKRIEEIFLAPTVASGLPRQKNPIVLPHDQPALQLLQRLRDETHRFAITFHRKLRSKQAVRSALDDISGVGPKTKKLLKAKFGTVAKIKQASLDELREVVGEKVAKQIKLVI